MISVQVGPPPVLTRQVRYWCGHCEVGGTGPAAECWHCGGEDVTVIGTVLVEVPDVG